MAERRSDEASVAPRRTLSTGSSDGPVLPPMPKPSRARKPRSERVRRERKPREVSTSSGPAAADRPFGGGSTRPQPAPGPSGSGTTRGTTRGPRKARLRVVQVDPWSVTKTAFLLSIAIGVVSVVAVTIVWSVLGASGLWDNINASVQETLGDSTGQPFDITEYVGTSRVIGFTLIVAVVDVVLITMIATLGAFLYNLAATLLGGVEVTLAEDE